MTDNWYVPSAAKSRKKKSTNIFEKKVSDLKRTCQPPNKMFILTTNLIFIVLKLLFLLFKITYLENWNTTENWRHSVVMVKKKNQAKIK